MGNRYDSCNRRDFCGRVRDTQSLSWEKDQFPGRRRERSWSRGHDDHQRSRPPRVRSDNRSDRDDIYDHKRNHEHSSVVPYATVVVMGLSKKATKEDLHQILARWGPLRNVRVIKERNSSSCRGIAFVDFPSVVKARTMMDAIGYDDVIVDSMMLRFEYSLKKIKSKNRQIHEKRSSERRRQKALERATTDAPAPPQQHDQYKEKVLAELVEEREADEMVEEEREAGEMVEEESEAGEMVVEEGEVEESEAEDMVSDQGEAEDGEMVSEEGEMEDSEAEEMVSEEGEVEDNEAEEMLSEEGEAGDSEAEEMEDGEEKAEDNGEEGEVGEDMVEEEE
ncbi:hypothetical protein MKW92_047607 [Papaver armeniacum]|nr:hypothetical protein MKW92_047607 [Papaver armeniacum]